jgi:hypothetical protein
MAITTFADGPGVLTPFCQRWGWSEMFTKPMVIACQGCEDTLRLVMASDTKLDGREARVFLVIELLSRGWKITSKGAPRCPRCGLPAD